MNLHDLVCFYKNPDVILGPHCPSVYYHYFSKAHFQMSKKKDNTEIVAELTPASLLRRVNTCAGLWNI